MPDRLLSFGKRYRKKIEGALQYLAEDPLAGKKMWGEYRGCYALKVWPYRIIYRIQKKKVIVLVLAIGHRQGVYK